ncbi:MAG: hypothetical protein ACREBC_39140 [Pyrinomonadaceae bacterium]
MSYDDSWIDMQQRARAAELAQQQQLVANAKPQIRVTAIELLTGPKEDSPIAGKGYPAPFDPADNPTNYVLDVNQGGVDPESSIFTDRVTVLLNIRARDLTAQNKPISLKVSAFYTSLYRSDGKAGIESRSISKMIYIKLLIGVSSSTVREMP